MMIDPRDLRIGNYIQTDYEGTLVVQEVHSDSVLAGKTINSLSGKFYEEGINPIPLTEEWLLKLGFREVGNTRIFFLPFQGRYHNFNLDEMRYYNGEVSIQINTRYVHTLQNLFHALSGEELVYQESL